MRLELFELQTNPLATPDLGHVHQPFLARARLQVRGLPGGAPWALSLGFDPGQAGLDTLELSGGLLQLRAGPTLLLSEPLSCTTELPFASPDAFLRGLIRP